VDYEYAKTIIDDLLALKMDLYDNLILLNAYF